MLDGEALVVPLFKWPWGSLGKDLYLVDSRQCCGTVAEGGCLEVAPVEEEKKESSSSFPLPWNRDGGDPMARRCWDGRRRSVMISVVDVRTDGGP